jgi:glutathione peroxidase
MNRRTLSIPATLVLAASLTLGPGFPASAGECPAFLDHDFKKLRSSQTVNLCEVTAGKPVLIVNTASHCGYTPQFKGLEALHQKYKKSGLVVVGFPSDDFRQEADTEDETAEVCHVTYGVTFTMLAPSSVKGAAANPVFQELGQRSSEPAWNFNKYLVSADGKVVQHFGSKVTPESPELNQAIGELLK